MFDALWTFLKDPANRAVLGWIGGGIVVVVGGLWAAFQFYYKKDEGGSKPSVTAKNEGVAIGRDNFGPIDIDSHSSGKR